MMELEREISWHAPEFETYERGPFWFLIAILIVIGISLFSIWQKNYLFLVLSLLGGGLFISLAWRMPRTLKFSIEETGVRIDALKYIPYAKIDYFMIDRSEFELSSIVLKLNKTIPPLLRIHCYTDELARITPILEQYVSQHEYHESGIDTLARLIKF